MTDRRGDAGHDIAMLDEIVPAVRARRHRAVIAAALVLGAATVFGAVTGWIVPLTDGPEPLLWGGTGPVHAVVHVANDSPRDIEITGMGDAPDGLSVVGYTTEPAETWDSTGPTVQTNVFPMRLAPDEGVEIAVIYRVDDCGAASQTEDLPTIELRFPDWTGVWTHSRQAALLDATPWTSRMTEFACPS